LAHNRHFGYKKSAFGEDGYGHEVIVYGDSSGSYLRWSSTANQLEVVGAISVSGVVTASGGLTLATETGSSASLSLSNHGLSVIGATSGGEREHALAAPIAGVVKTIFCADLASTGTDTAAVWTGSTQIFFGSSDNKITFDDNNTSALLVGIDATKWGVIYNGGTLGTHTT
jgi:hypothetical protein